MPIKFISLKKFVFYSLLTLGFASTSIAQKSILDIGIRVQKTVNLYTENGLTINYSNKKFKRDKLYFGFTYVSSRIGTAYHSNAIKQDNFLLSAGYYFKRNHSLRPFIKLNTGYFYADYGDKMFDVLPHQSIMIMPETGLIYKMHIPLKVTLSLGYNVITGNGTNGPGTLYPLNYAVGLTWNFIK